MKSQKNRAQTNEKNQANQSEPYKLGLNSQIHDPLNS